MEADIMHKLRKMQEKDNLYAIIAKYFLTLDEKELEKVRIKDVERNCHVSSPSVMRFCKEIGVNSFSRFKYELLEQKTIDMQILNKSAEYGFDQPYSYKLVVNDALNKTYLALSREKLYQAVELLHQAKDIQIFAGGSTYFAGEDLERKMRKVEKYTFVYNDDYWMRFAVVNAKSETLLLGFLIPE